MNTIYRTQCRLPCNLASWIKSEAKKEGRSMNAQLVWIASQAMKNSNREK